MEIRAFRAQDIGAMRAIWNEVVNRGDAFPQTDPLRDDAEALEFFASQTYTAVATEPPTPAPGRPNIERILGLYILHPNNIGRCAHIANASYAVASTERGHGVGRALVKDSIAQLAPNGFSGLQFNAVVASNVGAIALYESVGFTRIGTIPRAFNNAQGIAEDVFIYYIAAKDACACDSVSTQSAAQPVSAAQDIPPTPTPAPASASAPVLSASEPAVRATAQPAPVQFATLASSVTPMTPSAAIPVLSCRNLSKRYGSTVALKDITLSLAPGRVVGLLGPNGSGKTTLIKLAAGLLQPSSGSIAIAGMPPGPATKALVSYLPERPYFAPSMKVHETLAYFADFYADFDEALARTMLADLHIPENAPMASLSKGTKEKVQLILVMARSARLYLLDEPIGGVDPATRDYILRTIIGNHRPDSTLLISTHLVIDVESVLDDVIFLGNGSIIAHSSIDEFKTQNAMNLDEYFRRTFAC